MAVSFCLDNSRSAQLAQVFGCGASPIGTPKNLNLFRAVPECRAMRVLMSVLFRLRAVDQFLR